MFEIFIYFRYDPFVLRFQNTYTCILSTSMCYKLGMLLKHHYWLEYLVFFTYSCNCKTRVVTFYNFYFQYVCACTVIGHELFAKWRRR